MKKFKYLSFLSIFLFIFVLFGCGINIQETTSNTNTNTITTKNVPKEKLKTNRSTKNANLVVHFINVGQADSILIQQGSKAMLIDAGNNSDCKKVENCLFMEGIQKLDYVIGTHPHEDHIGGLDYIINNFMINKIYLPKATSPTKTFEGVTTAIKNKGMKATVPKAGETFNLGSAKCTIIAPNSSDYKDLNNSSIVIKIEFGKTSFLFTGDAEDISEKEILAKGLDVKADLLKVGHHGSHFSTTDEFLSRVNPKYAVISCEIGNDYGHPHKEVMNKLKNKNIPVYRTDELGTIVAVSNGKTITFNTKPGSYNQGID